MQQPARPTFTVSVTALMIFQVAALFARSMLELSLVDRGLEKTVAQDLSYLVVPPILLVLMFPYLNRCRVALAELLSPADLTMRVIVLSVLLGLTLRMLFWCGLTLLIWLRAIGTSGPDFEAAAMIGFNCAPLPVIVLSLTVVAFLIPVIEELINRGFILHALLARGTGISVLVSALLFAAMHTPSSYVLAFLIGLLLALQMLNYRTLWAPIITHATYNATTVLDWECFRIVWSPPASDPALQMLAAVSAVVIPGGTCAALYLVSKKAGRGKIDAPAALTSRLKRVCHPFDDV
ncbi:MAG: CPBP family intramembrane glutamic endopeptidase [Woeseia sp.]